MDNSKDNIVQFPIPTLSELDKQFLEIEKQQKEIKAQRKLIKAMNNE